MKHINVEKELALAHAEYEAVKRAVLYNLRAEKQCYRKLHNQGVIEDATYKALLSIANNTIKFIKMKEI